MLKAEQTNMEGAWRMGMRPLLWIWWTTSGRSPGLPSAHCVTPTSVPIVVATTTVYTHATCEGACALLAWEGHDFAPARPEQRHGTLGRSALFRNLSHAQICGVAQQRAKGCGGASVHGTGLGTADAHLLQGREPRHRGTPVV